MSQVCPSELAAECITIHGAREHNLKNISLAIPRDQLVVVTGVSGSGKSTLVFDLIFAEGQRRFLDAMNTYARGFVEQMARPDVDLIQGLPPTVSIEQRNSRGGGKSTVATVTEIYHFLRLLFARIGRQHCPDCGCAVEKQTRDEITRTLEKEAKARGDLLLLAPVVRNRKGFHSEVGVWAATHGYKEVRADGKMHDTAKPLRLDRFREHNVEIAVGLLEKKSRGKNHVRLIDDALRIGQGTILALDNHRQESVHSTERSCPICGRSFPVLDPKMFSYNSSQGWCPRCRGFGELFYLPDVDRGARADAIEESWFEWQEGEREKCPECEGSRLNAIARAVRLPLSIGKRGKFPTPDDFARMTVEEAFDYFEKARDALTLLRQDYGGQAPSQRESDGMRSRERREAEIARDILPEMIERLKFLRTVGLHYVELGRAVPTLSGGEAQRIRLAAQLGSNLSGVLYVLDEPTIGLHPRDNDRLLEALDLLKGRGNTLLVVEHDEETMRRSDFIIDLGPGAGVNGGSIVAAGTLDELLRHDDSITGQSLRATRKFPTRGQRRRVAGGGKGACLRLSGAKVNNLKNLKVRIPLERFVVVTGVSGSGKSSLVRECLAPSLAAALGNAKSEAVCRIEGHEQIRAVYEVDQSPIGRTPRSIPATYVGFFDLIRQLFAQTPEARLRGYTASRFSFNSAAGRCPECEGAGTVKLEMSFLPPAYVTCETCRGSRFNGETLQIEYRGRNIAQVLELSVAEAVEFFASFPRIKNQLQALVDTGLDYLKLGQSSPTLSGGEAQRIKLVTHLMSGLKEQRDLFQKRKANFFVLEEPTIGLHMADVRRLIDVLQRLVDAGHTVLVIEHNLDLIAEADWVVDLGPEAGDEGGRIVAEGPPEAIAQNIGSHTGRYLRTLLAKSERSL